MSTNAKTRYNISKVFGRLFLTREVKTQIQVLTTWQVSLSMEKLPIAQKKRSQTSSNIFL